MTERKRSSSVHQPHQGTDSSSIEVSLFPDNLFFHTRFRRPSFTLKHVLFFLYFPFGLVLATIRLFFLLLSTFVLFDLSKFLNCQEAFFKLWCMCLGLFVSMKNRELLSDRDYKIIVSNHVCEADALALAKSVGQLSMIVPRFYSKFFISRKAVTAFMHPIYIQPKSSRHVLHEAVQQHLDSNSAYPLALFPEGCLTHGKVGLVEFNKYMFSLGVPIKPIALKFSHAFDSVVNLDHLTAPVANNAFFFLMLPWMHWNLEVLPTESILPSEDGMMFAKRVQILIADKLGLVPSDFHVKQKYAMVLKSIKLREMSFLDAPLQKTRREKFGFKFAWFYNFTAKITYTELAMGDTPVVVRNKRQIIRQILPLRHRKPKSL
ncbi:hypothetical protein RCL1_007227 [Eukaryota sp. TZLM3-RCL]